jgi:uncharacterized protein
MKYLVLLIVVAVVVWAMTARRRSSARGETKPPRRAAQAEPMLACAHCGVHLPRADAVLDAAGRAYCGQAHRLAGPR